MLSPGSERTPHASQDPAYILPWYNYKRAHLIQGAEQGRAGACRLLSTDWPKPCGWSDPCDLGGVQAGYGKHSRGSRQLCLRQRLPAQAIACDALLPTRGDHLQAVPPVRRFALLDRTLGWTEPTTNMTPPSPHDVQQRTCDAPWQAGGQAWVSSVPLAPLAGGQPPWRWSALPAAQRSLPRQSQLLAHLHEDNPCHLEMRLTYLALFRGPSFSTHDGRIEAHTGIRRKMMRSLTI